VPAISPAIKSVAVAVLASTSTIIKLAPERASHLPRPADKRCNSNAAGMKSAPEMAIRT
jgi:hypothetical protein